MIAAGMLRSSDVPLKPDSSSRPNSARAPRVRIGVITGTHGLGGALRIRLDNPASQSLDRASRIWLEANGIARDYCLASVSAAGRGSCRVTLDEITDIDSAERLKGAIVLVSAEDLPPASEHEFYYHSAIGCAVVTVAGDTVGEVADIFATGANDVLVVRGEASGEVLVPVIGNVIKAIDLAARRIVIDPVPGLLD